MGDFAVTGALLAIVRRVGGGEAQADRVADAFVLHEERLVDGDIAFPLRQLADVALKGLSPGVNDPTTAENALDSITDTLVRVARHPPVSPLRVDAKGVPRLLAVAPSLDALVRLGFDQVRRDAADRPSFAVRLLELLADLREAASSSSRSDEIDRQAQLVADRATALADQQADQRLVTEAYQRLHAGPAVAT